MAYAVLALASGAGLRSLIMSHTPTWRDRVVERTLARTEKTVRARGTAPAADKILNAAIDHLMETGGAAFSVQDVVDRADVALKTFYRHFGTKDALLLALLEEWVLQGMGRLRALVAGQEDPLEQLRVVIMDPIENAAKGESNGYYLAVLREHYRLMESFPAEVEQAIEIYRALVASVIEACVTAGRLPACDAVRAADTVCALLLSTHARIRLGTFGRDPHSEADYCWRFCVRALLGCDGPDQLSL